MARLFWLSDEAWAAIEPHLPRGKPGKPRVDDRRVISGILHVLNSMATMCRRLTVALARSLERCPCCATRSRRPPHQTRS